jgi:ankyrin repeat protein
MPLPALRPVSLRRVLAILGIFGLLACQEGNSMGITAIKLDTRRYFADPKVAAFVADVQDGKLQKVSAALHAGMNPNVEGNEGFQPLFFIFPAETAEVARALLAAGANPNVRLSNGITPLYFAVRMKNPAFTQVLLEAGANPNARVENNKPVIHEAVLLDQSEQLKLLARAGADINVVWGGDTPLYAAIRCLNWNAVSALLDLGADTQWRSPGGRNQDTAGELFCFVMPRLHATPTNRKPIQELFAAFARRGVALTCAAEVQRFR